MRVHADLSHSATRLEGTLRSTQIHTLQTTAETLLQSAQSVPPFVKAKVDREEEGDCTSDVLKEMLTSLFSFFALLVPPHERVSRVVHGVQTLDKTTDAARAISNVVIILLFELWVIVNPTDCFFFCFFVTTSITVRDTSVKQSKRREDTTSILSYLTTNNSSLHGSISEKENSLPSSPSPPI